MVVPLKQEGKKQKDCKRPLSLLALSFKDSSGALLPKGENQLRVRRKGKVVQVIINYSKSTWSQMISQSSTLKKEFIGILMQAVIFLKL